MDIKALRYFVELVNQQSFTRASEQLYVTQPTISKMIRSLELEVGQPLLHREGRRFWLTEAGEIVYQRAVEILAHLTQLKAELIDLNQLQRGQLRLGIPPMVGHLYAGIIRQYRQAYPNVEMTIVEYGGRKIEQAILNGEIDVAVTMLSPHAEQNLNTLVLDSYPIYAVLPNISPWKEMVKMTWDKLRNEPFYLYTKEFNLSDCVQSLCQQQGFTPQIAARSSQWDFLVALVKSGVGVAFLPEPLCQRIQSEGVLIRPITPTIDWRLSVIWHGERYVSRTAEAWIELCEQYQTSR
ncbi:LysR family transcriptional regulator [Vibrio cincinnatiensis]|uniref:LysR family transcriptional regulator n=1 Tax=Vibrio cincinnatiensis TaxID=675 RepID=UPI001EE09FF1|nr:LysR family transcriptional regulator [Vibrio cincinnatiensis]MCG3725421.1 LysR family transcriptional regulator [Vibrio cincinnatiensis]MCG3732475.1 LysR family transcriptional regulator [Vibrio cincinnatiensis]MCG3738484.1 LysR family transcriptional regulator [Vibrio cincinnatiensis]MCG3743453.1 LysR family transcriptional regulator [Vibrio cincinnatiensis]